MQDSARLSEKSQGVSITWSCYDDISCPSIQAWRSMWRNHTTVWGKPKGQGRDQTQEGNDGPIIKTQANVETCMKANGKYSAGRSLYLTVRGGSALWEYAYRLNKVLRTKVLGSAHDTTLQEAEAERPAVAGQSPVGIKPGCCRRPADAAAHPQAGSLSAAADDYQ